MVNRTGEHTYRWTISTDEQSVQMNGLGPAIKQLRMLRILSHYPLYILLKVTCLQFISKYNIHCKQ